MTGPGAPPSDSDRANGLRAIRLRVYPVKGMRGTELRSMEFDDMGPRFDRRWMVVRADGGFASQRDTPRLATVRPRLADGALRLETTGAEPLILPVRATGSPVRVRIHGSGALATSVSPEADAWLSGVLGGEFRLVFMRRENARTTDPAYAGGHRVSFADGYPALVVSEASVDELARRAGRAIPVERFRPNLVVAGAHPHDEDKWRRFAVGDLDFSAVKLCARCKVTTTDQETGARDPEREPLRTLALYRRIESSVYFGVNVVHHGPGRIAVGDRIEVTERGIVPGARPGGSVTEPASRGGDG
ncbi:MAG: MOSC domain-containing protein [Gemmatimonadota bacterium]|nr:MOSC domain-containing protein [Gemmatimonadota bacterium]MDE2870386.1 MOSC domain-containing protein [Gemmatimonadota bacterium]